MKIQNGKKEKYTRLASTTSTDRKISQGIAIAAESARLSQQQQQMKYTQHKYATQIQT